MLSAKFSKELPMHKLYVLFEDQLDTATLNRCMEYLPAERRAKALRYRQEIDRKNCVAAYLLLLYALWKDYGILQPTIACSASGKPYLPDYPNIHFNISHCPKGCICAVADSPIGADIQDVRPFSWDVAQRCCSQKELRLLTASAEPALTFTKMWAMKESYLKMTGVGIAQDLSQIDTTKLNEKIEVTVTNDCCIAVACADKLREELQ